MRIDITANFINFCIDVHEVYDNSQFIDEEISAQTRSSSILKPRFCLFFDDSV